jgi:uncharacterized protein YacL
MTPTLTINLLRALFVTLTACLGLMIVNDSAVGMLAGAAFGLLIVLADRLVKGISLRVFSSATVGLLIGFIFANLLLSSKILSLAPPHTQWLCGLMTYVTASYFGMMLAIRSNRDEFALIIPYVRFRQATVQDAPLLIDSNIIIDGRIASICATGFLSSSLIIPRFVLEELQRLADSSDPLKRERGRLALDRVQLFQSDSSLSVTIHESESDAVTPVDARLLQTAKLLDARLLTNDGNLCALARIQGISVLNLHDLAKALRPNHSAGESFEIALVKEGRDFHQAVGYLADGTMVVVNHAREQIGQTVAIVVASTVQTSAGRLFFADLRAA